MGDVITIVANLENKAVIKGTKEMQNAINSVSKCGAKMASTVKRMVPMILGVGSAFGVISKAVNAYMQQNQKLQQQMSSIWTALGNLLGPIIEKFIGWVTTAVSYLLSFLKLLGVTSKTASQLSKAAKQGGQEMRKTIAGFDELNVMQDNSGSGGAGLKDFEPPDWMKNFAELIKEHKFGQIGKEIAAWLNEAINGIRWEDMGRKIHQWIGYAVDLAIGLLTFDAKNFGSKVATLFNTIFHTEPGEEDYWKNFGKVLMAKFTLAIGFLTGFLETMNPVDLAHAISDIMIGALEALSTAIGDANWKQIGTNIGEFFKNIKWGEIASAMWTAFTTAFDAGSDLFNNLPGWLKAIAIGLALIKVVSAGITIFQNVSKAAGAIGDFAKNCDSLKGILGGAGGAASATGGASDTVSTLDSGMSGKGGLFSALKNLAKNMAMGILIIAEAAIAVGLVVGAIWVIGKELEAVGEAWQPVIDNGDTILEAMTIGTAMIAGFGAICALLGEATKGSGGTIALDILIGAGVLVECAAATLSVVEEVKLIGERLVAVGDAWEPIMNGKDQTILTAMEVGSALLIGFGAACALIGAATVATGGLLAVAIAAGAGVLLECAGAVIGVSSSIADIANEFSNNLSPALNTLNTDMPTMQTNFDSFIQYITTFGDGLTAYVKALGKATWASIVSKFTGLFTGNPVLSLSDTISGMGDDATTLNEKLTTANEALSLTASMLESYNGFIDAIKTAASAGDGMKLKVDYFTNMRKCGNEVVKGFAKGMGEATSELTTAISGMGETITEGFDAIWTMVGDGLRGKLTEVLNWAVSELNTLIASINSTVTRIPYSSSAKRVPSISPIPHMATGGVLPKGKTGYLEGDGAEAVVPLERNTQWISRLAEELISRLSKGSALSGDAKVNSVLSQIADTISYRVPSVAQGTTVPYNVDSPMGNTNYPSAGNSDPTNFQALIEEVRELKSVMENMQFVADFGNNIRALAKGVTREQKRMTVAEGR